MAQVIVGLDIGTTSIRVTRLEASLFRFEFKETTEHVLPTHMDLSWDQLVTSVLQVVFSNQTGGSPYKIIASLPGRYVSSRVLSLPFTDKKKIEQTLPFELEGLVPFPIEEVLIDYEILGSDASGSKVLAVCTKKSIVDAHLKMLKASGIDPQVLVPSSVALANLSKQIQGPSPEPILIVDFGHEETALSLASQGRLVFCRTLMTGSSAVTKALEQELGISHAAALELKEREVDLAATEPPDSEKPHKEAVQRAVSSALEPLVRGITQTLAGIREAAGVSPRRMYLCGKGSALRGLPSCLSRKVGLEVCPLEFQIGPGAIVPAYDYDPLAVATSMALALHGTRDNAASGLNLRTGEFAHVSSFKALRKTAVSFGAMAGVLAILLAVDSGLKYHYRHSEYERLQASITKVAAEIAPDIKGLASDKQKLSALMAKLDEEKRELGLFATISPTSLSVLDVLLAISEAVPEDVKIDVRELAIEGDKVRIQGETSSSNAAEQIKSNLLKKDAFANAEIMDVKPSVDRSTVKFQMNLELRSKAF